MAQEGEPLARRFLTAWVGLAHRAALAVVLLACLSAGGGLFFAADTLAINTSTKDMLWEELPFRRNLDAMEAAFPRLDEEILIVVEGEIAERAEEAAAALAEGLAARPDLFQAVFYPEAEEFFRRNGLLYLELDALHALADRLAEAQPLLAALSEDLSLGGLAAVLGLALEEGVGGEAADEIGAELGPALAAMADSAEGLAKGRLRPLSWQALLSEESPAVPANRRLIVVSPVLDFSTLEPARAAIGGIRALVAELDLVSQPDLRVRITGDPVMLQDELKTVQEGIGLVGLLSLVLVTILLGIGLRSLRLVGVTLTTLLIGLCWTALFAAVAVGELNLISVAFAVLFIGLSVDFGIHFALRVEEEMLHGADVPAALKAAAGTVGGPLALTALAAAISFLSFLPTTYRGLSELGLISGAGMFIALFANLTVLPALFALFPPRLAAAHKPSRVGIHLQVVLERRAKVIVGVALLLGIVALLAVPFARFDDDPLNLRDPDSPSVRTLLETLDDPRIEPYAVKILTENLESSVALAGELATLPEVGRTETLLNFVPEQQDDKLAVIDEMAFFLGGALAGAGAPVGDKEPSARRADFEALKAAVTGLAGLPDLPAATRLADALSRLDPTPANLARLETLLLGYLPGRLTALAEAITAEPVDVDALPEALKARKLTADGRSLLEVFPAENLRERDERTRFVDVVSAVAPQATGAPMIITAAGRAVVDAFLQAAGTALLLITLLLLWRLRNLRDSLLVLAPLTLAALLTIAATVVLGRPFNFANVIVLPLLFGLGVAGGIHMVARSRDEARGAASGRALMYTSTPRAVLFSALTTIGSFCALATSSHKGMASMGELLTISIGLTMLSVLIVLPALLALRHGLSRARP